MRAFDSFAEMTRRNDGYLDAQLRERLRATRLLVAGCGLGSVVAETALRTGFERFALVDGDTIAPHNLNRQAYADADVGANKAHALARRLRAIHPGADVAVHARYLSEDDADELLEGAGLVIDTIDFLDLPALVAVHDAAVRRGVPVLSAFACGWGAVAGYFPPGGTSLREVFGLPPTGSVRGHSHVAAFQRGFARLGAHLPPEFVAVTRAALAGMADGLPCPAPQLAIGAQCAAALLVTQAVRVLAGEPVPAAPELLLLDLAGLAGAGRQGARRIASIPEPEPALEVAG